MKLTPGMQDGEIEGSLHEAMMQLLPDMKMDPDTMQPGKASQKMVDAMLQGWRQKYGDLPGIEPIDMSQESPRLLSKSHRDPSPTAFPLV